MMAKIRHSLEVKSSLQSDGRNQWTKIRNFRRSGYKWGGKWNKASQERNCRGEKVAVPLSEHCGEKRSVRGRGGKDAKELRQT